MNWLTTLFIVIQVLAAISIIVLVLIQHGKGADMGAAFGSGASGSLFGASGAANFLSRSTAVMAAIFFVATLALVYVSTNMRPGHAGGGLLSADPASVPVKPVDTTPKPGADVPTGTAPATPPAASPASGDAAKKDAAPASSTEVPK